MHENTPILVAAAQQTFRDLDAARSPVDAMAEAAKLALEDSNCPGLAGELDAIATVCFVANANPDAATLFPRQPSQLLARRLGNTRARCYQAGIGGNTPQMLANHFAGELASGRHDTVLICGGELIATLYQALAQGHDIGHWADDAEGEVETVGSERDGTLATEQQHGLFDPINTYPLFENAIRHHLARSSGQHQREIADICSRLSTVAATNPLAWKQTALSPDDIATVDARNRYIGFPYTRAMNAILAVDMSAAVVMTTVGKAKALGIDQDQWVYLHGGADLNDSWWVSERASYHRSPALQACARAAFTQAGMTIEEISCFDLYSCFPCAVEIACDALGVTADDPRGLTLTGGLPYFGGPGNNYSLHAICEMVRRLRDNPGSHGLVSALGYYITKHSIGIYSSVPPDRPWQNNQLRELQQTLDDMPHPSLEPRPTGGGNIDTWTVAHSRSGPARGIIIGTLDSGRRFVANTRTEEAVFRQLLDADPIGLHGVVSEQDGLNLFEF